MPAGSGSRGLRPPTLLRLLLSVPRPAPDPGPGRAEVRWHTSRRAVPCSECGEPTAVYASRWRDGSSDGDERLCPGCLADAPEPEPEDPAEVPAESEEDAYWAEVFGEEDD